MAENKKENRRDSGDQIADEPASETAAYSFASRASGLCFSVDARLIRHESLFLNAIGVILDNWVGQDLFGHSLHLAARAFRS
jgi:hypothetical protein